MIGLLLLHFVSGLIFLNTIRHVVFWYFLYPFKQIGFIIVGLLETSCWGCYQLVRLTLCLSDPSISSSTFILSSAAATTLSLCVSLAHANMLLTYFITFILSFHYALDIHLSGTNVFFSDQLSPFKHCSCVRCVWLTIKVKMSYI